MKFSSLYLFINEWTQTTDVISGVVRQNFIAKTDKSNNNYFLYELNVNNSNAVIYETEQSYQLISHHLSFYELFDDNNPYLSQYHYTAYFRDEANKTYELHVYFDQNDKLKCNPIFTLIENDKNNSPESKSMQSLLAFAINESVGLIRLLRELLREHNASLEKTYNQYESKLSLLSINLAFNKNEYLDLLFKTIEVLKRLIYFNNKPYFESLIKLFQRTIDEIQLLNIVDINPELSELHPLSELRLNPSEKIKIRKEKISLQEFVSTAGLARNLFLDCKRPEAKTLNTDMISTFLKFHQNTYEILLLADDHNYQISLDDLRKAQEMAIECTKEGQTLLQLMLVKKDYSSAIKLVPYLSFIQEKMLNMALAVDNGQLLDFILTYGEVALNSFTVSKELKSKSTSASLTPLLYCFNENKKQCFAVLLKHGASPMVLADDGLPLAHHIFSGYNHPLKEVFNTSFTNVELIKLFQTLLSFTRGYKKRTKLSEDELNKLEIGTSYYERMIPILKECKSAITQQQNKSANEQISKLQYKINNQALVEDKDLQLKYEIYNQLVTSYLKKLNPSEKRQELKCTPFLKSLNQLMDKVDFKNLINFELAKESTGSALDSYISIIKCKLELLVLRKAVQKPVYADKLGSQKKQRANLKSYNEKVAELNKLQEAAGFNDIEKASIFANDLTNINQHLSNLIDSLNSLLGISLNLVPDKGIELKLDSDGESSSKNLETSQASSIGFFGERSEVKTENKQENEDKATFEL